MSSRYCFGPEIVSGSVHFRLWAPDIARGLELVLDGKPHPMQRDSAGWWTATEPCRSNTLYGFRLPDGLVIPDPASRFQPQDVHGPSAVCQDDFVWTTTNWRGRPWTEAIVYELHAGALGGFAGVRERLPHLAELGVTAIELMPIADFPGGRNWGYDGVLPFAPDSSYGTPQALKALVDAAHGLGLMVILDVVYNHFGPDGNYLSRCDSKFFDKATKTPWGPAINFANPSVRRFFSENAVYWLDEFRIDGLRLDAVHHIADRAWLEELAGALRERFAGRHIHLILENERNDAGLLRGSFTAQWNDDFHNVMHVLLTGETASYYADFADRPAERLARALREGFIYQGEPSQHAGGKPRGSSSAGLSPTAFVNFLQNHDQVGNRAFGERLTRLVPPAKLKAAVALQILMPSIPLIFMGEEEGSASPFLFFTDFNGELARAVREGRRSEFAHDPAFTEKADAIPDPNAAETFNRSQPQPGEEAQAWRDLYRQLIAIRAREIVPHLENARSLDAGVIGAGAVTASWSLGGAGTLIIAANFGGEPVPFEVPDARNLWGSTEGGSLPPDSVCAWIQ